MNRFSKQQGAISTVRPQVGGDLFGIMVLVILLGIFSLSGCQDSFMKQTTADKTSAIASLTSEVDAAGNVTATFDPNSGQTQVLQLNSGSIAGAAVAIPPGSLSIPVSVVVGEGESLASSSFSQQIGLTDNAIAASGPSVSFIPSQNVQATNPFTLAIPFSAVTALALNDAAGEENLVVMFRSIKVENGTTSYREGVIPREQITVSKDKVTFQTTNFGLFQVGVAQTKVRGRIEKPAAQPPALITEVGSPLIGVWGRCEMAKEFPDPKTVKVPDGFFGTKTSAEPSVAGPAPIEPPYFGMLAPSVNSSDSRLSLVGGIEGGFQEFSGKVKALEFWRDEVFIGGSFSRAGGFDNTVALARWDVVNKKWLSPVTISQGTEQVPLTTTTKGPMVNSVLESNDSLYVAGRFLNAFGLSGANHIVKLTKDQKSGAFTAHGVGETPLDCDWISDVRKSKEFGNSPLFVVCNNTAPNTNLSPTTFKTTSRIWKVDTSLAPAVWSKYGPIVGKDLSAQNQPQSAIQSFDVSEVNHIRSNRQISETFLVASVKVNGGQKIEGFKEPVIAGNEGTSEELMPGSTVDKKLTIRFVFGSQLLVGGFVNTDGKGVVKVMDLGATPLQMSDLIQLEVKGPVTALQPNFIAEGDLRLAVGSFEDFQVYKLNINSGDIETSRMLPSDGEFNAGKRIVGPKTAIIRNLKDTSTNSYIVAGMLEEKIYNSVEGSATDCDQIEVSIAKDQIFLPTGFIGDPVQLIINNTSFNNAQLQDLVQKEAAVVPLISTTMAEIEAEGDSEGGMVSLPKGCGFTRDGKTLLSSFVMSSKDFIADGQKVCRYDIRSKQPDTKIVCAGAQISPSIAINMVRDGEQWFGRVRGQVYSKREALRFNRSEVFRTTEYFKSKDCTGILVSSKTESGAYALPVVDVSGTIPIDMKFYKASGKIVAGDWFKSLDRAERYIGSCGVSDWQLGDERDLPADKTCFSPFKVSRRMQVTGDELQICGAKEEDVLNRPEDCAEILQTFKRPPKR